MEAKEMTKVEPTKKMKDIMDSIEAMTVMELADLVKVLKRSSESRRPRRSLSRRQEPQAQLPEALPRRKRRAHLPWS